MFKQILEIKNVNNICDYIWLLFLPTSNYLEPQKLVVLKLTLAY